MVVLRCARTGQIAEPMLTDQWFMAMTSRRDGQSIGRAIAAVERATCASCRRSGSTPVR
ncbi:MAG: hypothetical protein U1E72_06680 [Burkholderiaceae bacterium]